ncbi:MAG: hypothetical protein K2W93_03970, partial [Burkholderiaceae bacterium]|nr:hypothetical protein [Burkholderiaceae bacterium]
MNKQIFAALGLAVAALAPAQAALVTDASALTLSTALVDFENFDGLLTTGPVAVAPGVIFTGDV